MRNTSFVLVCIVCISVGFAGGSKKTVSMKDKRLSVSVVLQPTAADTKLLPFIDAVVSGQDKRRCGVFFGDAPTLTPVIEILDEYGNVLHTLTVGDLLGNGVENEDRVLSGSVQGAENVYNIQFQQRKARVVVRASALKPAGESEHLLVTFAMSTEGSIAVGLRIKLPVTGNAMDADGGVAIAPNAGPAALLASFVPRPRELNVQKNRIVVTSEPVIVQGSAETTIVSLMLKKAPPSTLTDAR